MASGYEAMRSSVAAVWLDRDFVRAAGPDATPYLQGQLSQDVGALGEGQSAWSWVLQPAGKVDALLRVSRLGPTEYVLDTDGGWGELLLSRLTRFKLRTKVDLEALPWRCLGLRGPETPADLHASGSTVGEVMTVDANWPGLTGVDRVGPAPTLPEGVTTAGAADYEAARIETGIPRMGSELNERTIPAETGLVERTVSFTKGCYTGQELVARIDSRGSNVPRHLRGLRLSGPADPGVALTLDGKEVGVVTSAALSPALGWVGLGYVRRAVEPPATVQVAPSGPGALVEALPLVG